MAVESHWLPVIQQTTLFSYEFDNRTFTVLDDNAGYFISRETVIPVTETRIDDPIGAIGNRNNVRLTPLPSLHDLANKITSSTLAYSIIRMRNARPLSDF